MQIGLGIGIPFIRNYISRAIQQFTPASLFANNEQGVWYDPSDFTTLFQDAAGTTPVTAVEQPVGMMLDKSKGLALGSELVDLTPDNIQANWTNNGNGSYTSNGSGYLQWSGLSAQKMYAISFRIASVSAGSLGEVNSISGKTATGTYTAIIRGQTTASFYANGFVGVADSFSVRELQGNHAFNSSGNSANFPVLSARYNLLTKTEDFSDAVWTKQNLTVTANTTDTTDPLGGNTADKIVGTATVIEHRVLGATTVTGVQTLSIRAKKAELNRFAMLLGSTFAGAWFDLNSEKCGALTDYSGITSASITALPNGWYQCSVIVNISTPADQGLQILLLPNNGTSFGSATFACDQQGIYIWGADLRVANDALNQPAYQRVNTSSDYDTVGFKRGEVFDGINDYLTASAGGGSTTSFFWCSAIRAGKVGAVQTLFSDAGTNTGYRVRINASNQLELSAGNGTAYTTVSTTATLSIGQRAVLTAWHDGTNLNVQINNGTVHQVAFATATAGTAQFTIGKNNNAASNFFAGWLYEKVYTKDNVPSVAQIADTKAYVANIAGITL